MMSNNSHGAENSQGSFESWLSGFVDGEGCFSISIYRNRTMKLGWQVFPEFTISQNIRNKGLLEEIRTFFGCGSVIVNKRKDNHRYHMCKYTTRDVKSLQGEIIPFFRKYRLRTHKMLDFKYFCEVLGLIEKRKHLSLDGLKDIQKIVSVMNSKRSRKFEDYLQRLDSNPDAK